MKSKNQVGPVKNAARMMTVKISEEAKTQVERLHEITGRTQLHILNTAIREYCSKQPA